MRVPGGGLAARLAEASVAWPRAWIVGAATLTAGLAVLAGRMPGEVGYAAYFGPESPEVRQLTAFLDEFESGFHLLIVFSCRETTRCRRIDEPWALDFLGRLHAAADRLPNVRRTWSLLNAPIVTGPLETRTLAAAEATPVAAGSPWRLAPDWPSLLHAALTQPGLAGAVVSADARSAGVVVELGSVASEPMRATVRGAVAALQPFERELGAEIHLAGDPVWTVLSADSLERDAHLLTALMFLAMAALLAALFRDPWLTVLPLVAVAVVTGLVEGFAAVLGVPRTSLLSALPPLLVAVAIAASIHLLAAVARAPSAAPEARLVAAARAVGPGCLWSAVTTAGGFGSFLVSDLASFRAFGGLAALGVGVAFVVTFTLLPALLCLRLRRGPLRPPPERTVVREMLAAAHDTVTRYPRFVRNASLATLALLAAGTVRLHYASDFGFGEGSYVVRSLRAMTTEVVVTLPPGRHVWEAPTLRLLERIEEIFAREPSTGAVWSFLDLLDEAHRLDRGRPASSFADLVASARRETAVAAAEERAAWFWHEATDPSAPIERTRVSVDRAWLDDAAQGAYVARIRAELAALEGAPEARGHRIEMVGGLVLADRFVSRLRRTQRESFAGAFALVAATLAALLRRPLRVVVWALTANALPVAALLGLMGWAGIGVDPAGAMVGAILLALGVDDTIHLGLRWRAVRAGGRGGAAAWSETLDSVGEAVVTTSLCLALGFSVLLFARWGGLVSFGLVASLGVALLLAGDLLLLPAALLAGERRPESAL
jgi:predicted RND superfamily exporter protein